MGIWIELSVIDLVFVFAWHNSHDLQKNDSSVKSSRLNKDIKLKTSDLFAQHIHRIFQAFECEREHAAVDPLLDVVGAMAVSP